MFGLPELDRDAEGRHREHAAPLHPRGHRGTRGLTGSASVTLLAIETAGSACSAAVVCDGAVRAAEARAMRHGHAEALFPMIERVMAGAGLAPRQLGAVAVAIGPGGFTGIRVGLAAAHGIALAVGARLVGITSFAAVAAQVAGRSEPAPDGLLVALDSRRADLYVQLFAGDAGSPLAAPQALLADQLARYIARPDLRSVLIAGDAAEAAAAMLGRATCCTVVADSAPDARGVAAAALAELRSDAVPSPVRPLYLRPPDVTLPKPPPPALS